MISTFLIDEIRASPLVRGSFSLKFVKANFKIRLDELLSERLRWAGRAGHRRLGIGQQLLEGAVAFAREQGAEIIEAESVIGGRSIDP